MRETEPLIATRSPHHTKKSADPAYAEPHDAPNTEQLSWKVRVRAFVVEYGAVGVTTHIVLSLVVIAVAYVCVSNGVDVSALLSAIGLQGDTAKGSAAHSAGAFVIAYAIYKLLAPVRIPLTFAVTPLVLQALRQRGYMLPPDASAVVSSAPETAIEMV